MMRRIFLWLAILCVVGLAWGLRLRALEQLPIDYDEDDYLGAAIHYAQALRERDLAEIINYDYNYEHPPLTKLAYGLAILPLTPASPIIERPSSAPIVSSLPEPHFQTARKLSIILGTLQVLVLALIDPLAGLLLAINTWQIKYTSQIMLEPLPSLTSILAVILYIKSGRRWNVWLFLSTLALGITVAAKFPYGIVGVAIAVHWLMEEYPAQERLKGLKLIRWLAPVAGFAILAAITFFATNPRLWTDPLSRLGAAITFHGDYATSDYVRGAGLPPWQPFVWLFQSVPWHPGVFLVSMDVLITLMAILGYKQMWERQRVFALWLVIALGFLLVWPTKWPQYILILTVPLSLASAYGFRASIWQPLVNWIKRDKHHTRARIAGSPLKIGWQELRKALPWLIPGLVVLGFITVYPMVFQGAMALTDFGSSAIRDGLSGGVWRETWKGFSGQVEPVTAAFFQRSMSKEVHYAGTTLLRQLIGGAAADYLVFGILWTFLAIASQTALGVSVALLLDRAGVLFKGWWRAIYILPWAIPEFVGGLMWAQIFDPRFGWFNQAGKTWYETADYPGAANFITQWQSNPTYALLVLLITATWCGFPFMMLAASAGLKLIPVDLHDAAEIDGAGGWKKFRFVIWPLLVPLLLPAVIIRAIFSFNQFYLFLVLEPPFPLATFSVTSFFFFDQLGQYGASAAINIFTILVLIALILWFNQWSKAAEGYTYA